ncbi:DUF998 domain-containing protein [Micromonosporaceae bacterium Da 78-11]
MTRTRLTAAAAALSVTGGAVTMLFALVAAPGPWWQGYVSEAGTAGQPYAVPYRWGLILLALGVAVLGGATGRPTRRPVGRLDRRLAGPVTAVCLLVAAVLAGTSGVVPCSNLCPLPPYEPTTLADVVHTAASILGMAVLTGAMAAVWRTGARPVIRRLAATGVALMVPLGATLGLTMVLVGRGSLGAVLERLLLVVAVSWLVGTASLTAATSSRASGTFSRR